jgi:hypothetical protein
LKGATELTAPGFFAQVGDEHLRHRPEHANVHRRDFADVGGDELYIRKVAPVVKVGDIRELARQPLGRYSRRSRRSARHLSRQRPLPRQICSAMFSIDNGRLENEGEFG